MWEEVQGSTTAHSIQSSVVSKCSGLHRGDGLLSLDSDCFQSVLTRGHASLFSLTRLDSTSSRSGRNIVGHRAIVDDSGQSGGNITVCAAIANVLHRHATLSPDNTDHIVTFLDNQDNMLIPAAHMDNTQEPIMLSYGTMSASIMQPWSKTGLLPTHDVWFRTFHPSLHFSVLSKSCPGLEPTLSSCHGTYCLGFVLFKCYFFLSLHAVTPPCPQVSDYCIWQSIFVLFLQR